MDKSLANMLTENTIPVAKLANFLDFPNLPIISPAKLSSFTVKYLIVIPWPQGICLIYMPEGAGMYIRQIPSGHGISNIYHSGMLT